MGGGHKEESTLGRKGACYLRKSLFEKQVYWLVLIGIVCFLIAVIVYTARAEGPYGILNNGGFEGGFRGWGPNDSQIPNGWEPFVIQDPSAPPQFKDSAAFGGFVERLDGEHCLVIWSHWVPFDAGIYQQVGNVTPGTAYQVQVEWAPMQSYNAEEGGKQKGDFLGRVVGIDPTGGTDPNSPNIVWSQELWKEKRVAKDYLRISAVAQSNTITVFLRAKNPQPHGQDQVFFDVVSLVVDPTQPTAPPPTDTPVPTDTRPRPTRPPKPTNTPTLAPTDTPVATFTATSTATPTVTETPTETSTPIPTTPAPTRTPRPTPTPASLLENPPRALTGMLLLLGFGSLGTASFLGLLLGLVWWQRTRHPGRGGTQSPGDEYDEYYGDEEYFADPGYGYDDEYDSEDRGG